MQALGGWDRRSTATIIVMVLITVLMTVFIPPSLYTFWSYAGGVFQGCLAWSVWVRR